MDGPRMIDDHVICADIDGQNLIYLCADGSVNGCLNNNILALDKVLDKGSNQTLSDCTIDIEDDYIFALVDGQLWFYGDYQLFVEGRTREDVSVNEKTDNWHLLSENIIEFSYGQDYIAAINDQNEGLLWGEFFESCSDKDDQVNWLFFENKKVMML